MERVTSEIIIKVHELFKDRKLTLSVAESCTGGLICHYITSLPGASAFFRGGIVSYSDDIKKNIIGVTPETIERFGVVSAETACEMAERVRLISSTDFSLSATGNLGPDVLEKKERGLVYIAACRKDRTVSRELRLKGDRERNKEDAALEGLRLLVEIMLEGRDVHFSAG
ncbi:MAG: CinA family protein [Nitrospiraceae bacterium]|nr:MAG: CinA family protein [Nitrospiraceae bacterium]